MDSEAQFREWVNSAGTDQYIVGEFDHAIVLAKAAWEAAAEAEREACANLVETMDTTGHDGYIETTGDLCEALAARIRRA